MFNKLFVISIVLIISTSLVSGDGIPDDYADPIYSFVTSAEHDFGLYTLPNWVYTYIKKDSLWYSFESGIKVSTYDRYMLNSNVTDRYDGIFHFYIFNNPNFAITVLSNISKLDIISFSNPNDVYANDKDTTISNGVGAKYFHYIKTFPLGNKMLIKQLHFRYHDVTYSFELRVPIDDWNKNKNFYNLYLSLILVLFETSSIDYIPQKSVKFLKYHPVVRGDNYHFKYLPNNSEIYIYNLQGKLINKLQNGLHIWNGRDMSGNKVSKGFYISNIRVSNENYNIKINK